MNTPCRRRAIVAAKAETERGNVQASAPLPAPVEAKQRKTLKLKAKK